MIPTTGRIPVLVETQKPTVTPNPFNISIDTTGTATAASNNRFLLLEMNRPPGLIWL